MQLQLDKPLPAAGIGIALLKGTASVDYCASRFIVPKLCKLPGKVIDLGGSASLTKRGQSKRSIEE